MAVVRVSAGGAQVTIGKQRDRGAAGAEMNLRFRRGLTVRYAGNAAMQRMMQRAMDCAKRKFSRAQKSDRPGLLGKDSAGRFRGATQDLNGSFCREPLMIHVAHTRTQLSPPRPSHLDARKVRHALDRFFTQRAVLIVLLVAEDPNVPQIFVAVDHMSVTRVRRASCGAVQKLSIYI